LRGEPGHLARILPGRRGAERQDRSEMLGDPTQQLRGQVDDFLGKIRAA
jgi:hypothetical protein